jgi:DNA-binding XRE family transcriptional regulator
MNIEFENKIEQKINEYIDKTGATKTWIAKKMGYKSKQALDGAMTSKNPTIKTLLLFADFLECDIKDLYDMKTYK